MKSAPQARKFWHFGPPKMRFYKGKTVQNRPDFGIFWAEPARNPPLFLAKIDRRGGGFLPGIGLMLKKRITSAETNRDRDLYKFILGSAKVLVTNALGIGLAI